MKSIFNGEKTIKLCLWDTAGQEKFKSLIPNYLSDAKIAIIVYDITSKKTHKRAVFGGVLVTRRLKVLKIHQKIQLFANFSQF